jgi:hypothetical protein
MTTFDACCILTPHTTVLFMRSALLVLPLLITGLGAIGRNCEVAAPPPAIALAKVRVTRPAAVRSIVAVASSGVSESTTSTSMIIDFSPTSFPAKANAKFFYSIGNEVKYADQIDPG